MGQNNKKKRNIIIILCIAVGGCLIGCAVTAALLLHKNPLAKGLANFSEEIAALEAERGGHFLTDTLNRIGSGNMQAEYSVNIGGIPGLQNITVGLDGKSSRDMEQRLFYSEVMSTVANTEIAEVSLWGTPDMLYAQIPTVWDGTVVFDAENVSGQWNDSAAKTQLQLLTGYELGIDDNIDVDLFQSFSVTPFSAADFLNGNRDALKELYKNMEVVTVEKALKNGAIREEKAESLLNYALKNAGGEDIETVCYIVILQEKDLKELMADRTGDLRLAVYLDSEKRIVRVCMLSGETLAAEFGEGTVSINLTGEEATIDRVEIEISGVVYGHSLSAALPDGTEADVRGSIVMEKQEEGFKISADAENLVLKLRGEVICRGSGEIEFAPLAEEIRMPAGKEYRIAEMNGVETALFLANCTKNIYKNYSGYLKLFT